LEQYISRGECKTSFLVKRDIYMEKKVEILKKTKRILTWDSRGNGW